VIFGDLISSKTAIWDPETNVWTDSRTAFGTAANTKATTATTDEETWSLMPDGLVVTVPCYGDPKRGQKYLPAQDIWVDTQALLMTLTLTTADCLL
jgi:hypothetical protein